LATASKIVVGRTGAGLGAGLVAQAPSINIPINNDFIEFLF
jgi:hypothetical protein